MPPESNAARRAWPLTGADCLLDSPEARLRLAATTAMAATLVHEVNQPLTAAANYLSAGARRLRALGEGYEDVLAMLDHASQETLKAGEIIRRTRNFVVSGRISGARENLRTMVERAILMLGERRDAVGITVNVPLDLYVKVDRIQIEQLLANLLANGCDALAGARGRLARARGGQNRRWRGGRGGRRDPALPHRQRPRPQRGGARPPLRTPLHHPRARHRPRPRRRRGDRRGAWREADGGESRRAAAPASRWRCRRLSTPTAEPGTVTGNCPHSAAPHSAHAALQSAVSLA